MIPAPQAFVHGEDNHVGGGRCGKKRTFQFGECGDQPVKPDGGTDAGQLLLGVQGSEIVVSSAGTYGTELVQTVQECFVDDARVVVQPLVMEGS